MDKLLTMTFAAALLTAIAVPAADPNEKTVSSRVRPSMAT